MRTLAASLVFATLTCCAGCATVAVHDIGTKREYIEGPAGVVVGTDGSVAFRLQTRESNRPFWAIYDRKSIERILAAEAERAQDTSPIVSIDPSVHPPTHLVMISPTSDETTGLPEPLRRGTSWRWSNAGCARSFPYVFRQKTYRLDVWTGAPMEFSSESGNIIRPILAVPTYVMDVLMAPVLLLIFHDVN